MTGIKQLEGELNQKINELNESLNVQYFLRETLQSNTQRMTEINNQLKEIEVYLKYSNEYFDTLKKENLNLKLSCDEWVKRAIKLEFEVLSARDAAKNRN